MNPPLSFADALTQLKLLTSQTGNFTFTDDELTLALQEAWNDTYVVNQVWDNSLTYAIDTWQYSIPSTVTAVRGIYFQRTTTDDPEPLDPNMYNIVNGEIHFTRQMQRWIGDSVPLYVKGSYKLTTSDNLVTANQVNYVLNLAAEILLNSLLMKRTFVFLTNDTTVGEIVTALNAISSRVLRYKQALLREFETV